LNRENLLLHFIEYYHLVSQSIPDTNRAFNKALSLYDMDYALGILGGLTRSNQSEIFRSAQKVGNNLGLTYRGVIIGVSNEYAPVMNYIKENNLSPVFSPIIDFSRQYNFMNIGSVQTIEVVQEVTKIEIVRITETIQALIRKLQELERRMRILLGNTTYGSLRTRLIAILERLQSGVRLDIFDRLILNKAQAIV
jgi:hypothetical protein